MGCDIRSMLPDDNSRRGPVLAPGDGSRPILSGPGVAAVKEERDEKDVLPVEPLSFHAEEQCPRHEGKRKWLPDASIGGDQEA